MEQHIFSFVNNVEDTDENAKQESKREREKWQEGREQRKREWQKEGEWKWHNDIEKENDREIVERKQRDMERMTKRK